MSLAACGSTERSETIGGRFTLRWSAGYRLPDSHVARALYYGKQRVAWNVLEYSVGPGPDVILYERNEGREGGLYAFNGRTGTNARVHDVSISSWTRPDGSVFSSDAVSLPTQYNVYWSSDAAYVVVGDRYHRRCEVIDVVRARVVGPGWILATDGDTSFSSWQSDRTFTAHIEYRRQDGRSPRSNGGETLHVTVDPFEIRGEDGTIIAPS